MGGFPVAVIGYDATDALENYLNEHDLPAGNVSYKQLLQHLETETSTPIFLANIDDDGDAPRRFLCFYVDYSIRVYDCAELMAVTVPTQFERVKDVLSIEGDLRRVFAPKAHICSWDSNGRTRVK
jgi:hypothetical protein